MAELHGGHLLVRMLKKEGVELIFSLTGHSIDYIYGACIDEGLRIVDVRHEQAATHMADGWARITGRPGVVAVTSTPGVAAMVPGIVNGETSPIIAFSGKTKFSQLDMHASQESDQVGLLKPITKWARTVYETKRIPEYVSMAFRHALTGRPGPVFLDVPEDILEQRIDESKVVWPEKYRTEYKPQGDAKVVQDAVKLLLGAERPLVLCGSGVWWSHAGEALREFVELTKIPFILRRKGRGSVPEDHPYFLGPSTVGLKQADVILAIGIRFGSRFTFGRPPAVDPNVKVIEIDTDPTCIGENRPVEVGIIGDARLVLKQMIDEARDRCEGRLESKWLGECQAAYRKQREAWEAHCNSDSVPIHPARVMNEARDFLERSAVIITDGGETEDWAHLIFRAYEPGHMMDHYPNSVLGSGIPFAIASKLAKPDKQVLVVTGDGGFGINAIEFDTAVRHNLPIVNIISNNGCWGTCLHRQERILGGKSIGVELGYTRYDRMVEALGGYGQFVEKPSDIRPALERAFASGKPSCINVITDRNVVSHTASSRAKGGSYES